MYTFTNINHDKGETKKMNTSTDKLKNEVIPYVILKRNSDQLIEKEQGPEPQKMCT